MKPRKKNPSVAPADRSPHRTPITDISPEEQIVGAPLLGKVRAYDDARHEITLLLEEALAVGDGIRVKGRDVDLSQRVERLRVRGRTAHHALAGETVAIEVADPVRVGNAVYKVRVA